MRVFLKRLLWLAGLLASVQAAAVPPVPSSQGLAIQANSAVNNPTRMWALNYHGALLSDPLTVMASPPTVTIGTAGSSSTISGTQFGISGSLSSSMSYFGHWAVAAQDGNFVAPDRYNNRVSFMWSGGTKFDVRISRGTTTQSGISVLIDGQVLTKTPFDQAYSGFTAKDVSLSARHWLLVNFGANTVTYSAVQVTPPSGGLGYALGDTITLTGGTCSTFPVLRVIGLNVTAVNNATVVTPGSCTVLPANNVAQGSTSGIGTGATFVMEWTRNQSSLKPHRVDLIFDHTVYFGGVTIETGATIAPAPPSSSPKLVIAGDSITEYKQADYAGGGWSHQVARMLGLYERFVNYGTSGRGYISSTAFSLDLAGICAEAPDLLAVALGVNDFSNGVNTATLTSTVTSNLNTLESCLPKTRIVVVGPWVDTSGTYTAAIAAGVAAAQDQARLRFIDYHALGFYSNTSPYSITLGNLGADVHPSQAGMNMISQTIADPIGRAFQTMILNGPIG